jgi:hypothetical protein
VTRPRGPLAARVYWTRRLMVLGIAFLLVFGLAHLLGGGSDGKSGGGDTVTPVAADATSSNPTGSIGPTRRPTKTSPARSHKPPPLAQPDGPCSDDEVVVKPVLTSPEAGDQVNIGLEISSNDSAACTFRVSPSTVVVKLTSGQDFIWSSQECRKSIPTVDVVARTAVPAKVNVSWSGRRSDETCSHTTTWAIPGWYHAISAALGGEPTDVQFELGEVTPQTVTHTVTPTQQPTKRASDKPSDKPSGSAG